MGDVHYYALADEGRLVAVACGVLRSGGGAPRRWYACDMKVHPDYRGRHLPVALFRRAIPLNYLRCPCGYAIAMNPSDGRVPPAVRSFAHFKWLPMWMIDLWPLDIYSADDDGMRLALPLLREAAPERGEPHFVSLRGVKDLVLESTKASLALLHVRFGPPRDERWFPDPQPGHTHMWCVPRGEPLAARLEAAGVTPTASATVGAHRLSRAQLRMIDTSEI